MRATAIVRPWLGEDTEQGGDVFGDPYEILCSWEAGGKERRDANGQEFVPRYEVWTEATTVKHRDRVTVLGTPLADLEVRDVQGYGMEMFDDLPDYRVSF